MKVISGGVSCVYYASVEAKYAISGLPGSAEPLPLQPVDFESSPNRWRETQENLDGIQIVNVIS
jgi:hypothetical protein